MRNFEYIFFLYFNEFLSGVFGYESLRISRLNLYENFVGSKNLKLSCEFE